MEEPQQRPKPVSLGIEFMNLRARVVRAGSYRSYCYENVSCVGQEGGGEALGDRATCALRDCDGGYSGWSGHTLPPVP